MSKFAALCFALSAASLPAQAADEAAFLKRQAETLHRYAASVLGLGYPSMARTIWLEVLAEYDRDHAGARKALGYVKFNTTWAMRDGFNYPEGDNPSVSAAKTVASKWASVARKVGTAHKRIAGEFQATGRADRARYHFARALRFLPADPDVRAAMGHREFGGMSGTDVEETLFRRSKKLNAIVKRQSKKNYDVKAVTEAQPTFLTAAGLTCAGVRSDHFTIWGEWPEGSLMEGARYAERALAFCEQALVGAPNFTEKRLRARAFLFLNGKDHYKLVIQKTPALIPDAGQRKFILDNAAATTFAANGTSYRGLGAPDVPTIFDGCIRFVVTQYSGLQSDAMRAGIGHAVVGRFLGQNRMFAIARATGTVTNSSRKLLLPDMQTWKELAVEAAFDPRGTPAAQLPLLEASRFPTDGRIKAWSFCDYLLRRDPKLLAALDRCRGERNPEGVRKNFANQAGLPIDELEREWKDFWTGATPVLAALRNRQPALQMVSPGGERWLDAFNKARVAIGGKTVSWSARFSRNCRQHAEYLAANRKARGPAEEQSQRAGTAGGTMAGGVFAAMALVVTKGSPARVIKDWIHVPGYRDALIDPYLQTVGVYSQGPIAVFDVVRGTNFSKRVRFGVYPPPNSKDKPNRVAVKLLGPEVQRALSEHEIRTKTIGYPISLHGWRAGTVPASVEVSILQGGTEVEGFVLTGGNNRYASAPGLAVFYPFEPLKSGVAVRAKFSRPNGQTLQNWTFTPK